MAITMTEFAIERISAMLCRNQMTVDEAYLRIGLRSGGCSGYSYLFEFTNEPTEHDKVLQFDDLKICIDKKSYLFLNGIILNQHKSCIKDLQSQLFNILTTWGDGG